ncbi:MAG: nuclear transport factor 2 family protein [Actinobacteria bacterium]|nr:MAG: nuclear transport factor 2 family protein [Actinomycetota bacterium]
MLSVGAHMSSHRHLEPILDRCMAREMIDVVQRACEAWGAREYEIFRDLYTPDVTASGGALWMESGSSAQGVEVVIRNFEAIISMFERNEVIPEGVIEAGDTLVVPLMWRGLPVGSTSFIEQRLFGIFKFRDGQIESMTWFTALEEALEAVGLGPSAAEDMIVLERPTPARDTSDQGPADAAPGGG